ncbi:MAG: hypothetical protein KDD45_02105 [Bdellovibrionales bacterium]|nr:hypothetical protein [Bdellovibrionales bacterium]
MRHLVFILIGIYLSGCVSLNTVSLTSVPSQRSHPVSTSVERFMILGFNFDNDYVDLLTEKLKQQCPNGMISGILTKDESVNYFMYFFWKKVVTAKGYCLQKKSNMKSAKQQNRHRNPSNETSIESVDEYDE